MGQVRDTMKGKGAQDRHGSPLFQLECLHLSELSTVAGGVLGLPSRSRGC